MTVRGVIQYTRSPRATAQAMTRAVKAANKAAVEHWWEEFMPLHFTKKAARRYGYKPRAGQNEPPVLTTGIAGQPARTRPNPSYFWRKRREVGHTIPLVYSGESMRKARRTIRVTGTAKKATGVMKLPRYFYAYRKDVDQPDKASELTRVILREVQKLGQVHRKSVTDQLRRFRKSETTRAA